MLGPFFWPVVNTDANQILHYNNIPTFRVQLFFHMAIETKQEQVVPVFAKAEMLIRKPVNEVLNQS